MAGSKPNRDILTGGKRYAQKAAKSKTKRVEEVTFDQDARIEFLTGFHKRKLERKKKARQFHEEQDKIARLEERRKIREERKDMIQKRLAEINDAQNGFLSDGDSEDEEDEKFKNKAKKQKSEDLDDPQVNFEQQEDSDIEDSEWTGFKEDTNNGKDNEVNDNKTKGILKVKQVYSIQDKESPVMGESVVTIESMDNPNATTQIDLLKIAKSNCVDLSKSEEVLDKSIERAKKYARLIGVSDEEDTKSKPKKKKFRYLSKNERKMNNLKQKRDQYKRRKRD